MAASIFRPLRTVIEPMRFPARTAFTSPHLRLSQNTWRPSSLGPGVPASRAQISIFSARGYSTTPPDRPSTTNQSSSSSPEPKPSEPSSSSSASNNAESPQPESASPAKEESPAPSQELPHASPDSCGELPSAADSRRSQLAARFSAFMDNLQDRYVDGLQAFNSITGYSAIEAITANNASLEKSLVEARANMRDARERYQDTSSRQVQTQRDMATLLARKASWMQSDKNQFAELLDLDYKLEREVGDAAKAVAEAEGKEQSLLSEWVTGMSRQYYEHQVYSDRIRRASTWGTWGLMGVNVLLFLTLQFVAEPWKRGRLLNSMEEREAKLLDTVDGRIDECFNQMRGDLRESLDTLKATVVGVGHGPATGAAPDSASAVAPAVASAADEEAAGAVAATWTDMLRDPRLLSGPIGRAYEAVRAELRVKDVVVIGLQGAILVLLMKN